MRMWERYAQSWRLLSGVFKPYRRSIALVAALALASGLLEGIGINAIIPLFSFIGGGGAAPSDALSVAFARAFSYVGVPYTARFVLGTMAFLFLAKTVLVWFSQFITAKVMADFEKKTRGDLLRLTFSATWPFLSRQKVGHLDQMLLADVQGSSAIMNYTSAVLLALVNFVIYSALIYNVSPPIVFIAFFYGLFIFFIFMPLLAAAKRLSSAYIGKQKELAHYANEHLIGAKAVKAFDVKVPVLSRGVGLLAELRRTYLSLVNLQNGTSGLLQLLGVFFIIGLFVFLYKTSSFQFASFAVVVYALNKVFGSVQSAQMNLHIITMQLPFAANIVRYAADARAHLEEDGASLPFVFVRELTFDRVSFSYASSRKRAVADVTFTVPRGSMVGLIGPSGGGKTTVVDLLLRLISPSQGAIRLDDASGADVGLRAWRSRVGYVAQDVFLLNDTIENNIRFYDDALSPEDLAAAARAANLLDFIAKQLEGWQANVGERGNKLSGGERQRIALARALARKPDILILDEATSALDNESEQLIKKAIANLRGKVTLIVIAHRLSTIADADTLVVLEGGRVTEMGSPAELLKNRKSYFSKVRNLA